MRRLLAVLVLAGASASSVLAEVVQIKLFGIPLAVSTMPLSINWFNGRFFSTDEAMALNNPFPSGGGEVDIEGENYYSWAQFYQIAESRFRNLVGVEGTMIFDPVEWGSSFNGEPLRTTYVERTFFPSIDINATQGLTNWSWDGSGALTLVEATFPVSGTFNQAEQRFYVSDGRQYQVVPEPSSLSLLLAGGAVLMAGRRRSRG